MNLRRLLLCSVLIAPRLDANYAVPFGGDVAFDLIHANRDDSWLVNLDVGAWLEADLGELAGAHDWYLFVNPTLVWGAEEDWRWRPRLYQVWLKWDGSDHFNALFGLTDLSWHFHSLPSAAPFVRLPARSSGDFSPGSIGLLDLYPLSSPTVRIEFKPNTRTYLRAAATWLERDHQVRGRELLQEAAAAQRSLLFAEAGYANEGDEASGWRHRIAGIGGWWLPGIDGSWGLYATADARLWSEHEEPWQGLSGFVSISVAKAAGYDQEERLVSGFSYEGLLPGRDEDITALAFIIEHPKRQACELLHRVHLDDCIWLQASVQWQRRVDGTDKWEWRLGMRVGFEF
jgi:hypothetical protein